MVYEKNKNFDMFMVFECLYLLVEFDFYFWVMGEVDVVIVSIDKMVQLVKSSGIFYVYVWLNVIDKGLEMLI